MNNKTDGIHALEITVTVLLVIIVILIIACFSAWMVNTIKEDACKSAINNYFDTLLNEDDNEHFLNIDSNHKDALIKAITNNSNIKVLDTGIASGDKITFKVSIEVPSFAATLERRFPQLFTYSNTSYVDSKLNAMTEREYSDMIYSSVVSDFSNPTIYYQNKFLVTVTRQSKQCVIVDPIDFENHLLGNIYSYQNDDVHFLNFKELIFPTAPSLQTSSSEVSALFSNASPASTFSSPEILVSMGDSAKFSGSFDGLAKSNISLSVNSVQTNDETVVVTFKGCALSDEEITVPCNLFASYCSGRFIGGVSDGDVVLTAEPTQFQITFSLPADSVVFSPDDSPIYFSLK